jgi:hypothetical protein
MGAADQLKLVEVVKLLCHLGAKLKPSTAFTHHPTKNIGGIGPHEITEGPFVGNFLLAIQQANLVHGDQIGRETSVNTKDSSIYYASQSEVVEYIRAIPVQKKNEDES